MGSWDKKSYSSFAPLKTTTSGDYTASAGDYGMASGYTAKPGSSYLDAGGQKVYNANGAPGGTGSGGFFGDMSGMEITGATLNGIASLGNLYNAFESNNIARETMDFNKDMATKNYNMAKDAYDRRKNRSKNVSRQLRGESFNDVYDDNQRREAANNKDK